MVCLWKFVMVYSTVAREGINWWKKEKELEETLARVDLRGSSRADLCLVTCSPLYGE
jgi:hypothetical protein